jgi:hypothetical protein
MRQVNIKRGWNKLAHKKVPPFGTKYSQAGIKMPLMIATIVCTLFADRIDTVVKGDKKVKKVIVVFGVEVFSVCTFPKKEIRKVENTFIV